MKQMFYSFNKLMGLFMTRINDAIPSLSRLDYWVTGLGEVLAWHENATYTGHTLKKVSDGWFLVVRAEIEGKKMVCYLPGKDPDGCFWLLAYDIKHSKVLWKPDKYA